MYTVIYLFVLFSVVFSENCPQSCTCENFDRHIINCNEDTLISIPVIPKNISSIKWDEISITNTRIIDLTEDEFQNAGLGSLEYVSINHCKINNVHEKAFNNLTNLLYLDLAHNAISKLYDYTFECTKSIQFLILNHNKLESINEKILFNLKDLLKIDLSHNSLKIFSESALLNSKKLNQLLLNNNELTTLNVEQIKSLKSFTTLTIIGNMWTCDCLIRDLFEFMVTKQKQQKNVIYNNEITNSICHAPDNLKGSSWKNVMTKKLNCWLSATSLKKKVTCEIGETIKLSCRIESNTEAIGIWTLNNENINVTNNKYNFSKTKIDQIRYWYNLEISNTTEEDEGVYECVLKNNITDQITSAKITVELINKPIDSYHITIIVLVLFCAVCLILILLKCVIRCHILKNVNDQPNFHENGDDNISISSIKSIKV